MNTTEIITPSNSIEASTAELYAKMREIGPSVGELKAQRALFVTGVDRTMGLYPNPDQRAAILLVAGILDWLYFGESSDPLPPGLIKIVDDQAKTISVEVDHRIITTDDIQYARTYLEANTEGRLHGQLLLEKKIDLSILDPQLEAVIEQTDGYRLARSFGMTPPQLPQPRPLPPWVRAVREAQIDAEVRTHYGIVDGEHIPRRSPADFARRRAMFHLDDETMLQQAEQSAPHNDPLDKIRRYFTPIIIDLLQEKVGLADEAKVTHFRLDDDDDDYVAYEGDKDLEEFVEHYDYLGPHYTTLRAPGGYEVNKPFESDYLEYICNEAFIATSHPADAKTYQECLDHASSEIVQYSHDILAEDPIAGITIDKRSLTLHALMRQAQGRHMYRSRFESQPRIKTRLHETYLGFVSERHLHDLEARSIGRIYRYDAARYSGSRLIQTTVATPHLPAHDQRAELIFDFWEDLIVGEEPFVPGFIAVSHSDQRWGFMPDPEGDPHAEANVPLPAEGIQTLLIEYEKLGLQNLADDLRAQRLTVAKLVSRIKANTAYSMPLESGRYYTPCRLEDFDTHVRNRELTLQCSGSAIFLKLSLELLFGNGCAAIQTGYVLPSSGRALNAVKHAQVAFAYNGQTFILDATGGGRGGGRNIIGNFLSRGGSRNNRSAPHIGLPNASAVIPESQPDEVDAFSQEKLEKNKFSFEQQLMNVFDLTHVEYLYERLALLSTDDPLRRTAGILLAGQSSPDMLQATLRYVESIMSASETTLRSVDLLHYKNSEVLSVAKNALQKALDVSKK